MLEYKSLATRLCLLRSDLFIYAREPEEFVGIKIGGREAILLHLT